MAIIRRLRIPKASVVVPLPKDQDHVSFMQMLRNWVAKEFGKGTYSVKRIDDHVRIARR
jgi:hypothetical protein